MEVKTRKKHAVCDTLSSDAVFSRNSIATNQLVVFDDTIFYTKKSDSRCERMNLHKNNRFACLFHCNIFKYRAISSPANQRIRLLTRLLLIKSHHIQQISFAVLGKKKKWKIIREWINKAKNNTIFTSNLNSKITSSNKRFTMASLMIDWFRFLFFFTSFLQRTQHSDMHSVHTSNILIFAHWSNTNQKEITIFYRFACNEKWDRKQQMQPTRIEKKE